MIRVTTFYHFADFSDFHSWQAPLKRLCQVENVYGILLLAEEGINATLAGSHDAIEKVLAFIHKDERFAKMEWKDSFADEQPFLRLKVRLKKEIVALKSDVSPAKNRGEYVKPEKWNDLIRKNDITVIDTRNDYEVAIGTFKNAVNPKTRTFSELKTWLKENPLDKERPVAMFCTGGIRCEKSTAYLKSQGFKEVYHLEGGILKYLETVPEKESLYEGECFVFDRRVAVGHGLRIGDYELCGGCRQPVSLQERESSPLYKEGVHCPRCIDETTDVQKQRFHERHKQINLAKSRGKTHLGVTA